MAETEAKSWEAMRAKGWYVRHEVTKAVIPKALKMAHGDKGKAYVMLLNNGVGRVDILHYTHISQATYARRLKKVGAPGDLANRLKKNAYGFDPYMAAKTFKVLDVYYKARSKSPKEFEND